jgi:hypothetical protein
LESSKAKTSLVRRRREEEERILEGEDWRRVFECRVLEDSENSTRTSEAV